MKHVLVMLMGVILVGCGTTSTSTSSGETKSRVKIPRGTDIVTVDSSGATSLNGKKMSVYSLSDNFKQKRIMIDAHKYTPAAKIAIIMEEAKEAGITDVQILRELEAKLKQEEARKELENRKKALDAKALDKNE